MTGLGSYNSTLLNIKNESIHSGDAFFFKTSAQFSATNESEYMAAEGHVQILALSGIASGQGYAGSTLLCQVVNKTALGDSESSGMPKDPDSGAMPSWQTQAGMSLWALVAFGTVAVLL